MKLVQLLAKELKEWPEGVDVYAQDPTGSVFPWTGSPDHDGEQWIISGAADFHMGVSRVIGGYSACDDHMTANVTKSQWQAEREKINKPKWIRHRGGKCPVADDVKVLYRMRSGTITSRGEPSSILSWDHSKSGADIMAYRVIEETKDQEIEEVEDTNIGTLSITLDVNDVFKPMIASMKDIALEWGQIESPLKWRDEIIELEAYEEEFRREREKLILKLESEGFKLIDHVAPVYGEQIIDMSDWRNWKDGDIVECTYSDCTGIYTAGKRYTVNSINNHCAYVSDNLGKDSSCSIDDDQYRVVRFKLIQ